MKTNVHRRAKHKGLYTEVERTYVGEDGNVLALKRTTCCCAAAGATRRGCAVVSGNKTPCRCFCHSLETNPIAGKRDERPTTH